MGDRKYPHIVKRSFLFCSLQPSSLFFAKNASLHYIIFHSSNDLKFPVQTLATAMSLAQRFLLHNPDIGYPDEAIAQACLHIAGKMDDTYRRSKEITKNKIEHVERTLLETIGFDFRQACCAMYYVVKIGKDLELDKEVVRRAWNVAIDAYLTAVYLTVPTHTVALASIVIAIKMTKTKSTKIDSEKFMSSRLKTNLAIREILDLYLHNKKAILKVTDADKEHLQAVFKDICKSILNTDIGKSKDSEEVDQSDYLTQVGKTSTLGAVRFVVS